MLFDLGDVRSDRDIAAVFGAPFADKHPAAIFELSLESARAARLAVMGHSGADQRLSAGGHDRLIGRSRHHRFVRQLMQLLEVGIAEHEPVFRIPQYEGFRYGFDGVAQAQIGGHGAFNQIFLLGDVDGDTD